MTNPASPNTPFNPFTAGIDFMNQFSRNMSGQMANDIQKATEANANASPNPLGAAANWGQLLQGKDNPMANFSGMAQSIPGLGADGTEAMANWGKSVNQVMSSMGMPGMGDFMSRWALPTVDLKELEKRLSDLKTVTFWLEQNMSALKVTIQALEVQKMTLMTLQEMGKKAAVAAEAATDTKSAGSKASATTEAKGAAHPKTAGASKRR